MGVVEVDDGVMRFMKLSRFECPFVIRRNGFEDARNHVSMHFQLIIYRMA
jgi:hypothetical protein